MMKIKKFDEVIVTGDRFWVDDIYRKGYKAFFLSEDSDEEGKITLLVEHEPTGQWNSTESISKLDKFRIKQGKITIKKKKNDKNWLKTAFAYILLPIGVMELLLKGFLIFTIVYGAKPFRMIRKLEIADSMLKKAEKLRVLWFDKYIKEGKDNV